MKFFFYNSQKAMPVDRGSLKGQIDCVLQFLKVECDELSVHFVTKKKIAIMHKKFFNDPTPTDCISFPIDGTKVGPDGKCILGEIFICPEVAIEYSKKKLSDPNTEILLYVVHGILHLIGYDDLTPVDRRRMRQMEKRCMKAVLEKKVKFL